MNFETFSDVTNFYTQQKKKFLYKLTCNIKFRTVNIQFNLICKVVTESPNK